MKNDKQTVQGAMQLYLVTDQRWLNGEPLKDAVLKALEGGVTCVQIREKNLSHQEFVHVAKSIQRICQDYHVPLIINDDVEVMLEIDADGVHVGQSDMAAMDVRTKIGPYKILGVSVQTKEQALFAKQTGADYLGAGAVFHTGTKTDAVDVTYQELLEICQSVDIPVVAIGGIDADNMLILKGSHIAGVAVVSAIMAQDDIVEATKYMKKRSEELLND